MAGNHLTLHTNDKVVVTTSRGNQEKWFDAEKNLWYKVDDGCFEALAEAVSSEVLRNFTNAVRQAAPAGCREGLDRIPHMIPFEVEKGDTLPEPRKPILTHLRCFAK